MKVSFKAIAMLGLCFVSGMSGWAESVPDKTDVAANRAPTGCLAASGKSLRVFPAAEMGCGHRVAYLGTYIPDGKYRVDSGWGRLAELAATDERQTPGLRPVDVPESVDLRPRERVVENLLPRSRPQKNAGGRSMPAELLDGVVTLVYGREKALLAPRYVITDSKGRAIVSDPAANAIHVLDAGQEFRILAGKEQRVQSVGAIAVDNLDNIYVVDPEAGVVVVFDSYGRFVRMIGKMGDNEGALHEPTAIAIDRERKRLYVVDASRDMVLVMDEEGRLIQRAGGRRAELGVTFSHPSDILVKRGEIVVLDAGGTRVEIFGAGWKLLRSFSTNISVENAADIGMGMDSDGNVFLSDVRRASVRVYDAAGNVRGEFGAAGNRRGEFRGPAALWIDEKDRLYVCEKENRRVQVFQISGNAGVESGVGGGR
jgi:DNA-binding beta-propeller fold protein YncE